MLAGKTEIQEIDLSKSFAQNISTFFINSFLRPILGWKVLKPTHVDLSRSYVVVAYPHTSNWDTLLGLVALNASGVKPAIVIKDDWDIPVFGPMLKSMGVIFINRNKTNIQDVAQEIHNTGRSIVLAIEGTRSKVDKVKKGFYYFAKELGLDILPAVVNYKDNELHLLSPIETKDINGNTKRPSVVLKELREAYEPLKGTAMWPEKESPIV